MNEVINTYGIMSRFTSELVTSAICSDINILSKDLLKVQESDSYDWHLSDAKGKVVLHQQCGGWYF